MSAFLIADVDVHDLEAYKTSGYLEAAMATAAEYGGKYIVRGGETRVLEGEWVPKRLVVIEFPDLDSLNAFFESDRYRPWAAVRHSLADSNIVAVAGV